MKLMLKKILISFILLIIAVPQTHALVIPPDVYQTNTLPFGHNQSYSVHFRGNGEAVVSVKDIFTNTSDAILSSLTYRFEPGVQITDVRAYEVIQNRVCLRYRSYPTPIPLDRNLSLSPTPTPAVGGRIQQGALPMEPTRAPIIAQPICEEYQDIDYYSYNYGKARYRKANTHLNGNLLRISLPEQVSPNNSGSIILVYRAYGYAEKNIFGTYTYNFKTLETDTELQQVQVGITTDSDYVLKGAQGKINYQEGMSALSLPAGDSSVGIRSQQFDNLYYRIGQGSIIKTAANLAANESYSVKGAYAESVWKLYVREILIGLFTIQILIVGFIILGKKVWRRYHSVSLENPPAERKPVSLHSLVTERKPFPVILIGSFCVSILTILYTGILYLLTTVLDSMYSYYRFEIIVTIVIILISFCVYAALLIGPSLYIGMKRGVAWGIGFLGMTAGWLLLFLFSMLLVMLLTQNKPVYDIAPMPLRGQSIPGSPQDLNVPMTEESY
jgi:hypothetical protein